MRELKPLRLGEALSESFRLYRSRFGALYLLSVIACTAQQLAAHLAYSLLGDGMTDGVTAWTWIPIGTQVLVFLAALSLLSASLSYLITAHHTERGITMWQALRNALRRLPGLVVVNVCRVAVAFVPFLLVWLLTTLVPRVEELFSELVSIAGDMALGFGTLGILLALALPVAVKLGFCVHASAIERLPFWKTFGRSLRLSKGYSLSILGQLILLVLLVLFYTLVTNGIQSAIGPSLVGWLSNWVAPELLWLRRFGRVLIFAAIFPFFYGVLALLYIRIRIEKEGYDLEYLAEHFPAHT